MSGGPKGVMPCVYKVVVPILWVVCIALMWGSWKVAYIKIDMYPVLNKRNYNLIGGDAHIAPPKEPKTLGDWGFYDEFGYGKIPKPKPIVITPH